MVGNLEQLKVFFPKQLCLEFDAQQEENAREFASQFTDQRQIDRAYLNTLCLEVIIPSIEDIFDLESGTIKAAEIKQQHLELWQSHNGVAIATPQCRLVLIPTDELDTEELRVPQAWLNQPELAGDFYLAIQVSPESSWLRVWGFTAHEKLRKLGVYDPSDRSYAIDRADLWVNLESLPTIKEFLNQTAQEIVQKPIHKPNILSQLDFSAIWQPFEEFAAMFSWQLATDLRQSRFQRHWARKIDQEITLKDHPLALTIGFQKETSQEYFIQVRVSSGNKESYLPDDLELLALGTNGEIIDQAKSRKADNWIQVELRGELQEEFQIKVQRAEASIIEDFTI